MGLLQALGQGKPVTELNNSMLQYGTAMSNMETQRLAQKEAKMKIAQHEKDVKEYDPEAILALMPKEHQDIVRDVWKMNGVIDPTTGTIQGLHVRNTPKYIDEHTKSKTSFLTIEHGNLSKQNQSLAKKGDPESLKLMQENLDRQTQIAKELRLGKDKEDVLVPKGTKGTISDGVYKPLPGGTEDINNVDLGTSLGTAESGAEVYHTTLGNVSVDPDTQERRPYSAQADGTYSKKDEKDPASEFATFYSAKKAQGMDDQQISTAWEKMMNERQAAGRMAFAFTRGADMYDTVNRVPVKMNWDEINKANKEFPGRYVPATPAGFASAEPGAKGLPASEQLANFKGKTDPVNIRSVQLINALDAPTAKLREMAQTMPFDTGIQVFNKILRDGSVQVGGVAVSNWDTFVIEYTKEVNRAMTGVGTVSEKLITQQQDVLKNAKTLGQALGALDQIEFALHARRKAVMDPIYKGEKPKINTGPLTANEAKNYLRVSGGDKALARKMATEDGRTF